MTKINIVKAWEKENIKYSIVLTSMGHYCGYAKFTERPTKETGYDGILTYVPIHGGITYAQSDEDGFEYGFDCAHAGDETCTELRDIEWLTQECERMALAIQVAAKHETEYLFADTNERKAEIIQEYLDELFDEHGIYLNLVDNFRAMINVLCGDL